MPLSSNGLCEAEITMPRSYAAERVRYATAGVGTTPALVTRAPSLAAPCASSDSIHPPDSRVSRPTRIRIAIVVGGSARTTAAPRRRTVDRSSGNWPALPRTPSVPNRRGAVNLFWSVFDTGDLDLHHRRLDARDTSMIGGLRANDERVLAFAQTGEIDVCAHVF